MQRNCSYCSPEDLLSLRDAHQRMPVPTISHYYTVFNLSERALVQATRRSQALDRIGIRRVEECQSR